MPVQFSFDASYLTTARTLERGNMTTGSYPGLDYPNYASAVAPNQSIATSGGVDVFAITMIAGQNYYFDIDNGTIDLEFDIIDQAGNRVGGSDDYNGGNDPFLNFQALQTGTYYIAVHEASNDYIDGFFNWERTSTPTGSYRFSVSAETIPAYRYDLTSGSESRSYSDNAQTVRALGGNDSIWLNGGNDIGLGGTGNDSLYGGTGMDELSGEAGSDRLEGGSGDDVLRGGSEDDRLYGGAERDSLSGGTGNDYLSGETGNDTLWGEAGADTLLGGDGNDLLRGGSGLDKLYGGAGADEFHFLPGEGPASSGYTLTSHDRIEDFDYRQGDKIDLTDLAFGTLAWRGTGSFTASNQVRVVNLSNGYVEVQVNLDSDAASELDIMVKPIAPGGLVESDFLL